MEKLRRSPGRFGETQKKVQTILAMNVPEKIIKPPPVPFHVTANRIVSALERFDNKIDVALYLSK